VYILVLIEFKVGKVIKIIISQGLRLASLDLGKIGTIKIHKSSCDDLLGLRIQLLDSSHRLFICPEI
jgi:hypothetical protein